MSDFLIHVVSISCIYGILALSLNLWAVWPTIAVTGTSPQASVCATRVGQLAFLPRAEAYCGAPPAARHPFLRSAVSSTISHASPPPPFLFGLGRQRRLQRRGIPQASDEVGHSLRLRHAAPSVGCSCDPQDQSAWPYRPDRSARVRS